jgi:hypothetical protein
VKLVKVSNEDYAMIQLMEKLMREIPALRKTLLSWQYVVFSLLNSCTAVKNTMER